MQDDSFHHSPASRLLRTDHPQSLRAFVRMFGSDIFWKVLESLEQSVKSGRPSVADVLPEGLFSYYAHHPDDADVFNAAMAAKAQGHVAGIIAAYDFSGFGQIGDIGGGRGHLLRAALDAVPPANGVLFDLPHVIEEAASLASGRLTLQSGDFFKDALPRCDAYTLMEVVHDWGDEEAVSILQAVRRAAPTHATVLVIEQMVPSNPGPDWAKTLDIVMLALLGGRQRTRQEYATLFDKAGFVLQREIDTHAGISILEAKTA